MANDMFALTNSGLSAFLLSSVGAEPNGSDLTILSMLARLGKDPWAVAAVWARAPKATVIEELAESIARTPAVPAGLRLRAPDRIGAGGPAAGAGPGRSTPSQPRANARTLRPPGRTGTCCSCPWRWG